MYSNLVMWQWKRFYQPYVETRGLVEDVKQEKRLIALELTAGTPLPAYKKLVNRYINKRWYRFLKAYGFRKPKGSRYYTKKALSGLYSGESFEEENL